MEPLSPAQRELYEAQAALCLQIAAGYKSHLLSVATKIMGSAERGWDLYSDTCMNCHDAIQSGGFEGVEADYKFYLLRALRNNGQAERQRAARTRPITNRLAQAADDEAGTCPESRAHLATQISMEVRERFAPRDCVALELHAQGYTLQQISDMTGAGHYSRIHRRLARMKEQLRETFGATWNNLF